MEMKNMSLEAIGLYFIILNTKGSPDRSALAEIMELTTSSEEDIEKAYEELKENAMAFGRKL